MQPIEKPRDSGGRFTPYAALEATDVDLASASAGPLTGADGRSRDVAALVDSLVSYRVVTGGFTGVARLDDVRDEIRAVLSVVDQATFDARMEAVAQTVAVASAMEKAADDPQDTDAWEHQAVEFGLDADDYPATDWEPGDSHTDWNAYCAATLDRAHEKVNEATRALVDADEAARR